jgi:hypothetical protein
LGPKIRKLSILLAKKQPYFLIRGLKPQWFSKFKNVVVYFGIASHVGTRHAIADGDHNVLRKHEYYLYQLKKKPTECRARSYHRYQDTFGERGHHLPWTSKQGYPNCKSLKSQNNYRLMILEPFHTDYGEILSLYTLSRAASGGDFYLADIHDIEARISQVRPDIMEELRKPWIMVK